MNTKGLPVWVACLKSFETFVSHRSNNTKPMTLVYYEWLQQQPERQKLEQTRDKHREAFQQFNRDADAMMRKALAFYCCSQRIEDSQNEWQVCSEGEDSSMEKIYGIAPELMVEAQMEVANMLKQLAFQKAEAAATINTSAGISKEAFDQAVEAIGTQYDELKSKWEELNSKEESK